VGLESVRGKSYMGRHSKELLLIIVGSFNYLFFKYFFTYCAGRVTFLGPVPYYLKGKTYYSDRARFLPVS